MDTQLNDMNEQLTNATFSIFEDIIEWDSDEG